MKMAAQIFISYRRTQANQVAPIVDALRDNNLNVFFDLDNIDALVDFPQCIRDGLAASHAMLVWWSEDYAESEMCLQELRLGWQHARFHSSDLSRRIWILNPEAHSDHILVGELEYSNYLSLPTADQVSSWAQDLARRAESLVAEGPLAGERQSYAPVHLSGVPYPSPQFTGRGRKLWQIHSLLHPPQIEGVAAGPAVQIQGMGGIGKSELAAKYAEQFASAYPGGVYWLNLAGYTPKQDDLASAESAWIKALVQTLHSHNWLTSDPPKLRVVEPDGKTISASVVRATIDRLLGSASSLWILDNIPVLRPDELRTRILKTWLAPSNAGRTLITTRDGRPLTGLESIRLSVLTQADATQLLARFRIPTEDEQTAARDLVSEVGAHTLALTLLGHRLQQPGTNYRALLEQLHTAGRLPRIEQIAKRMQTILGGQARSILATFKTSIAPLNKAAMHLLSLASVCAHSEPIIVSLLEEAYSILEGVCDDEIERLDEIAAGLQTLIDANLLTYQTNINESVTIHPLLADAVPSLLGVNEMLYRTQLVPILLKYLEGAGDIRKHDTKMTSMVPHARAIARFGTEEDFIDLAMRAGHFSYESGAYAAAREDCEYALSVAQSKFGDRHRLSIEALGNLAQTLCAQGKLESAEKKQLEVLETLRNLYGEEDPKTLEAKSNLAATLWQRGYFNTAKSLHNDVLRIRTRINGTDDPYTLHSMNNLATVLESIGDLNEASVLLKDLMKKRSRVLGEKAPDTLITKHNLAGVLYRQGHHDKALALEKYVTETCIGVLGEEHPHTLNAINSLAAMLEKEESLDEVLALKRKVAETCERILGQEHPGTLTAINNLALSLAKNNEHNDARILQEQVLAKRHIVFGKQHPETSLAAFNLLFTLDKLDDKTHVKRTYDDYLHWIMECDPNKLRGIHLRIFEDLRYIE